MTTGFCSRANGFAHDGREITRMAMVTQCPHCTTAFNVTPDQLFVRDGRVRCGNCHEVFDGLVNLTSLEALQAGVPPPLAEAHDAEQAPATPQAAATAEAEVSPGFTPTRWPMLPDVPVVPVPLPPQNSEAGETQDALSDALPAVPQSPVPETAAVEAVAPRRVQWPWALAAALAALVLCGQALHAFRDEIAAHFPGVKPALVQACQWARCTIAPLQNPSVLAIQASDLLIQDKAKPQVVQLIVTLQNQSPVDVAYPAIDLVLNDRFDHAVARRVFLPAEYLRGAEANKTVIAASVATTIRIDLDLGDLAAGGFGVLLIPVPKT
jgi:predicted Zn finger-like uncharacterized protein